MRNLLARLGLTSPAGAAKAASVPLCTVCATYPLIISPLVAAGIIGSGAGLHVLRRVRAISARLPAAPRCKLCNAPFAGPLAPLMRLLGKGRSNKNPRFCGDCLTNAPVGGAEIELSLLFADVRGSTALATRLSTGDFAAQINR